MKAYFFVYYGKLRCRFTDGDRKKVITTPFEILPKDFHAKSQTALNNFEANQLIEHWKKLAIKNTVDSISEAVKINPNDISISKLIDHYIGIRELSDGSIEKYSGFKNIILPEHNIPISHIDKKFILELYNFFRTRMSINSAFKRMQQLRGFLNLAVTFEYISKNPMDGIEFKREAKEIIYLTEDELNRIKSLTLSDAISIHRDKFIFACYTGFEFSRVHDLKNENLIKGIDGKTWIHTIRKKTKVKTKVPAHPEALKILNKYSNPKLSEYCFPRRSNSNMNNALKQIQELAGISKDLHTHLARHTFATTICINKGISYETTAKMMGITIQQLVRTYGKLLDQRVSDEFWNVYDTDTDVDSKKAL